MTSGSGQDRPMRTTADNHQYEIAIGILIMTMLMPLILVVNLLLHPAPAPAPHLCMAADWPMIKTRSCARGLTSGGVCL